MLKNIHFTVTLGMGIGRPGRVEGGGGAARSDAGRDLSDGPSGRPFFGVSDNSAGMEPGTVPSVSIGVQLGLDDHEDGGGRRVAPGLLREVGQGERSRVLLKKEVIT
jgi:hypothetical protein